MKHLLKPLSYLVALAMIGCLFYACSDEELSDVSAPAQEADFTVRAKNGYLEFKDQAAFDQVKALLENMDDDALNAWESQFEGFTSLRSIDEKSIDAQEAWFDELRSMDENERNILQQSDSHFWYSNYVRERLGLFVLEDSGRYSLNIAEPGLDLINFLNQDGIYKVKGKIYAYNGGVAKIIEDGDDSKIKMLSEVTETNKNLHITVLNNIAKPFKGSSINGRQTINIVGSSDRDNGCSDKSGRNYVTANASIIYGGGQTYLYVLVTNYYRDGIFGGYTRKRTSEMRITGYVTMLVSGIAVLGESVNRDTGGKHYTRLSARLLQYFPTDLSRVEITGTLNIFGRKGTSCGDTAPSGRRWQ